MYDETLNEALRGVINDFDSGQISLKTEGDLRGFLFHRCVEVLSGRGHSTPIPVHAEMRIGTRRADLAIVRDAEPIVELKLEPFITDAGWPYLKELSNDIRSFDA